ncbi:MAG: hypothetical protein LJE93_08480, partial [Acidobacteria bacterium]|nr:hypothetical protein [Acidobacteriota bacterium]
MEDPSAQSSQLKSWLLATAAVAVCGPWPGWEISTVAAVAVCIGLFVLARPRGRSRWAWVAVALALMVAGWPAGGAGNRAELASQFDGHARKMLSDGEKIATEPKLIRLLGAAGEAVDPAVLFHALDRSAGTIPGRTIYLVDDRGQIIAWGGEGSSFPHHVRPLGQRQWGVAWSAGSADLWLRNPLLSEGRLVGAVIVSDRAPLRARRAFGMSAGRGHELALGANLEGYEVIGSSVAPGAVIPVTVMPVLPDHPPWVLQWLGWLALAVLAVLLEPGAAVVATALGTWSLLLAPGPAPGMALGVAVIVAGASVGRVAGRLSSARAGVLVFGVLTVASLLAVFGQPSLKTSWLPEHLLTPGWGGVWMVALALMVSGLPALSGGPVSLERRLKAAVLLALLGLILQVIRVPVELSRLGEAGEFVALPRGQIDIAGILPVPPEECRLTDLAPVLAE